MSLHLVLKSGVTAVAVVAFLMAPDKAAAQYNGGIALGVAGPVGLGCYGGLLQTGLANPGGGGGFGGGFGGGSPGGPGGILGNLANGLPGTGMGQQFQPAIGMSPTGRFYNYDLITGSGQLSGPLPIVSQFAGIGGMRMGQGGMGMGGMGQGGYGMGGMGMGGMGMGTSGLGGAPGQNGGSAGSRQNSNFALLPPGVQLNIGYNTLIGMPMTQAPPMGGMMPGMGMGMGRGMGGMGMGGMGMGGYGMNPMMGGKMMMGMGNGDYGL